MIDGHGIGREIARHPDRLYFLRKLEVGDFVMRRLVITENLPADRHSLCARGETRANMESFQI